MNESIELIHQLQRGRFYGAVTFKFEAGRIVSIKKEETLKPSELPGQPGERKNDEQNERSNKYQEEDQ
jgi:hypothetical protein